jgi:hypothetical protein
MFTYMLGVGDTTPVVPDAWTWGTEKDLTNAGANDLVTVTLLSSLPAGITDVEVFVRNGSVLGANDAICVQLGDVGGFENTGYDSQTTLSSGGGQITTAFSGDPWSTADAAYDYYQVFRIARVFSGEDKWIYFGMGNKTGSAGCRYSFGTKTLSGELTQVRLSGDESTGITFDNGAAIARYM